jgi:hypothetical protein
MVDRYAKFATEHLAKAANRLDYIGEDNVIEMSRSGNKKGLVKTKPLILLVARTGIEPVTRGFSIQGNLFTIAK